MKWATLVHRWAVIIPAKPLRRRTNCLWTVATLGISTRCTAAFSGSPVASIELAAEQFRRALAFSIRRLLSPRTIHTKLNRVPTTEYNDWSKQKSHHCEFDCNRSIFIWIYICVCLLAKANVTPTFQPKFVEIKQLASANRNRHQAKVKRNQRNTLYNLRISLLRIDWRYQIYQSSIKLPVCALPFCSRFIVPFTRLASKVEILLCVFDRAVCLVCRRRFILRRPTLAYPIRVQRAQQRVPISVKAGEFLVHEPSTGMCMCVALNLRC